VGTSFAASILVNCTASLRVISRLSGWTRGIFPYCPGEDVLRSSK
jgi:hypothetical protein